MIFRGDGVRHYVWRLAIILISTLVVACGGGDDLESDVQVVDPALFTRAAGQDFNVVSAGTAPLYCLGPTGTSYQWIVTSNGGLPIELTSYSAQQTTFVAPTVKVATPIVLTCRMTNGKAAVIDSRITVTLQPVTPPVVVNPSDYARAAGLDFSLASGATAPLYCLGPNESTYQWIVESNGNLPIELASYSAQRSSFVAPAVQKATAVVLICRMTVGSLPVIDSRITVTVQPATPPVVVNPADYVRAAGLDFSVVGGATAPFYCLGPNGSTYQWVVEANAGLPIELSSYNTQQTSFTAPVVTVATPIVLACRMTTDATNIISSRVTATVQPAPTAPVTSATLVSSISGNKTVLPGQRLALTGSALWYDDKATVVPGPLVSYTWSLGAGAPAGTVITPLTGSKDVEVILPNNITSAVFFPVVLNVAGGVKTSESIISVLVDPSGDVALSITPQVQTVAPGAVVTISTTGSSKFFYQWTQVSGPAVTLGGATTNSVGFVAPAPGELRLRVAIGYAPITNTNPGVYFLESVVTVR